MDISVKLVPGTRAKENFYMGLYISKENEYILKGGTTNELARRFAEHKRNNPKLKNYSAQEEYAFIPIFHLKLSQANTLKLEKDFMNQIKALGCYKYILNDRFLLKDDLPEFIYLTVKKTYVIPFRQIVQEELKKMGR